MWRNERFRAVFWRIEALLSIAAFAVPFLLAIGLGFVWLAQNGWLVPYIAVSVGVSALLYLVRRILRYRTRRKAGEPPAAEDLHVAPNPDWNARETEAFRAAVTMIRDRTAEPVAWDTMQALALEVVTLTAQKSGPGGKRLLDFTIPEALLLIQEVSGRFRADLRHRVPFSDHIQLSTLDWLWRHQGWAMQAYNWGMVGWRVVRFVKNPVAGVFREADTAILGGHTDYLKNETVAAIQSLLLEEIARVAVDLYSGRLKFSESELLEFRLAYGDIDRARLATPDAPLRIVVAGQVSAGKSSIVNALLGADMAETDASPTTERTSARPVVFDGMDCVLLDLPGLDGGKASRSTVLSDLDGADIVLWAIRANRPAREIDREVIAAWRAALADQPGRRSPPLIPVVTCVDTLLPGWPYPEHRLPPDASATITDAVRQVAAETGTTLPIPVSSVEPEWNIETLARALAAQLGEGLMVQRNRARLGNQRVDIRSEAARTGRGVGSGLGTLGQRLFQRTMPGED